MKIPDLNMIVECLEYDSVTGIIRWLVSRGTALQGTEAGHLREDGRIGIGIERKVYYAHKIAWFLYYGVWPIKRIDHVDNVPSHNWIENLRYATHAENLANQKIHTNNSTGFKGVHLRKSGKYRAYVNHNGIRYNLGSFATADEAHEARMARARELHGQFAREK